MTWRYARKGGTRVVHLIRPNDTPALPVGMCALRFWPAFVRATWRR